MKPTDYEKLKNLSYVKKSQLNAQGIIPSTLVQPKGNGQLTNDYTSFPPDKNQENYLAITMLDKDSLKELLAKYKDTLIYTIYADDFPVDLAISLSTINGVEEIKTNADNFKITVSKNYDALDKIIMLFVHKKCHINKMETEEGNLEMVFLGLTGKKLRD